MTTTTALEEHRTRIDELIILIDERIERARTELDALDDGESDVGSGDEDGGSEADSTGVERDRLRVTIASEIEARHIAEEARARADTDAWATCKTCGGDIGEARLEALPTTDVCVTCKAGRAW